MDIVSWNSLLTAILLVHNYIAALLGFSGSIICIFSILILSILCVSDRKIDLRIILLILAIILLLLSSYFKVSAGYYLNNYLLNFIVVGFVSLYLSSREFDVNQVISNIVKIGFFTLPFLLRINYWGMLSEYQMGFCYSIFPVFLCAILSFFLKYNILKVFSIVLIIKYGYIFAMIAPRGIILNIGIFIGGLIWVWKKRKWISNALAITSASAILLFAVINLEKLANGIQNLLDSYGISIYAIYKTLYYLKKGSILNGREYLWGDAIEGIKDKWLAGNGIGSYEESFGTYTHNIFLQSWWEGGLLMFLLVMVTMFFTIYMILQMKERMQRYFVLLLFVMSYGILLLSSTYWVNAAFWFSMGLFAVNYKKKTQKYESTKE